MVVEDTGSMSKLFLRLPPFVRNTIFMDIQKKCAVVQSWSDSMILYRVVNKYNGPHHKYA